MSLDMNAHKSGRLKSTAIVLLLIAVAGLLLFKWLATSTPVSKSEALEIFADDNAAAGPQRIAKDLRGESVPKRSEKQRRRARTADDGSGDGANLSTGSTQMGSHGPSSDGGSSGFLSMPIRYVPVEGVYAYRTEGQEKMQSQGFRYFPDVTYRNIVHTGSRSWREHHAFSEERQMWTDLRFEGTSQVMDKTRQKVEFGRDGFGHDFGRTLEFDPPIRLWWLPWSTGRSWEGTFTDVTNGKTYGTYEASTGTHSYMTVGDETVEVWLDEIYVVSHGEIEGTVEVRRWTSPAYGIAVREEITSDAWEGPIHYTSYWDVQLKSLHPDR